MLLSEAARSGRRFWRKSNPAVRYWLRGKDIATEDPNITDIPVKMNRGFDAEELVANDWECEPRSVTITAKDLRECIVQLGSKPRTPADIVNVIIEELELDT